MKNKDRRTQPHCGVFIRGVFRTSLTILTSFDKVLNMMSDKVLNMLLFIIEFA